MRYIHLHTTVRKVFAKENKNRLSVHHLGGWFFFFSFVRGRKNMVDLALASEREIYF